MILIQIINCSPLMNKINTTHSFVAHLDNVWARYLDFWRWSFLPAGSSKCFSHSFNITKQHCYWTPVQLLTANYLVGIHEITSPHLSINRHLQHSFPIKLHYKWDTYSDYFEGTEPFPKHHLVPDFFLHFIFYPSKSEIDRGILSH